MPLRKGHYCADRPECLRLEGHEGEHAGMESGGQYVAWWTDLACECEGCQSSEPADWCEPFSHLTKEEAAMLIASGDATLLDWEADRVKRRE